MGVRVLTPDVNTSQMDFSVFDGAIRFGLSAVRNVGEGVVQRIIEERMAGEPFAHFQDFIDRVDPMVLNKRTIESLIKAGAFDGMGHSRRSLVLVYEQWLEATLVRRRNEEMGQYTLFGGDAPEVGEVVLALPEGEWDQKVKLGFEREMLGSVHLRPPAVDGGHVAPTGCHLGRPGAVGAARRGFRHHRWDGRRHQPEIHPKRRGDALLPM